MASTWRLYRGLVAVAVTSAAAFVMCPNAAADPATPPPDPTQQLPGLPALAQLSPIIQQAAGDPAQATRLLMAAAQAFAHNPAVPAESKTVASSVNQFVADPSTAADTVPHLPPLGVQPGMQAHLPTGVDPAHAAGPGPVAEPTAGPPAAAPAPGPVAAPAPAPAAAPGFGPDAPPTQDFIYPAIGPNCLGDGANSIATALSVAGPATIPAPGPGPGQTAYVFTAVGTPGPAEVQRLPLNVTWVNLTTGRSGSATLRPRADINPDGPTTLTAIVDTGSGSIMSTIFGQVTTKDRQCQFMPTIGSTVVP
ncbi:hypothetical protein BST45_13585 [Mycobacterium shinjukuense]|uniref:Uncharacterized protein n=1 Tax=Mycobacterium shinjukuense TaxID=398694 RepID=A0A7I7MKU0_9MYCO|nr:hypothetical protein BST45_13585 [Mycobacterium shinjukuense]BBX72462.1 hypothetical protein MSHI_03680 [Mycobacterium shinjukuense]